MRLARALAVFALATALTVGGFSYRERTRMARLDAISAAQRQLAATQLAPAGVAPRAGVSARAHIDVRPPLTEAERAAVERVLRGHALTPARAPATPSAQQPPVRR
jgi:hypothetical protein